jgi:type IV secretory pathway VirJ component
MFISGLLAIVMAASPGKSAPAHSLPLVVMAPVAASTGTLAILLTGDGGWSKVDRAIADKLVADGDGVVGLNSLHYFAHKRTSAELASDVSAVARESCQRWSCQRIVLIGYSMGADVLPFIVNQLGDDVRSKVVQLNLISLGHEAVFRFFPTAWMGVMVGQKFATLPQLALVKNLDILCVYGTDDSDPACKDVTNPQTTVVSLPTGHTMSKVADDLASIMSARVKKSTVTK